MGAIEEHAKHKTKTEGCLICAARKDWGKGTAPTGEAIMKVVRKVKDNTPPEVFAIVHPDDEPEMAAVLGIKSRPKRTAREKLGIAPSVTALIVHPAASILGIRVDDMTREEWLLLAVEKMRPDFVAAGREVPTVRISIGWPGGRTARMDALGQCWGPGAVADGVPAIFITPSQDDPVQVLATTRHEMVHAAGEMHHKAGFRKLAAQVGFDPRPGKDGTSSTFRTPALQTALEALYADLGPFPHASVKKGLLGGGGGPKVQTTRMLKLVCPEDEYTVRTTAKWIAVGLPSCPEGHEMEVAE
jgi:hypothetical protein